MSEPKNKTIRILLIEDDPGDAGLVLEAMRAVAVRAAITHVKTLAEARAWLGGHECDVILTDLSLPDSQGFPTIAALQEAAPALPVIVLSGNDDFNFALRAVQAGTQDFLVKGEVDGVAIHRSILYAIQRKQLEEDLRKAKEAAEASTRAKAHFLAVMSHEIRTPMNGILGLSHVLLEDCLSPEQHENVKLIQDSASNLLTILNDILDFSRLEADRMEVRNAPFDLHRVVNDIVALLRNRAREKGIGLRWDLPPDLPRLIVGDSGRLRQLLLNLIGNAVKFTMRGEVTVRVLGRDAPARPGAVPLRFEVSDTGIGIEPEVLPTLFTAFTQGDATVARRFGGTGLGLAICRKIVERLGGAIGVDSRPGHGSLFWFDLDFTPVTADLDVKGAAKAETPAPPSSFKLLVADDSAINQVVARRFLENAGHAVTVVADGAEAVEAVRGGGFDAVLMDVQMPKMDGLEATRAIRALPPPLSRIPIIALTASAMADEVRACLEAGMNDHLPKPVDPYALAVMLAATCRPAPPRVQPSPANGGDEPDEVLEEDKVVEMIRITGKADFREIIDGLEGQFADLHRALIAADASGQRATAAKVAHDLKGMVGNFRMKQLTATLGAVELIYRKGDPAGAAPLLPLIAEQFAVGLEALRHHLD